MRPEYREKDLADRIFFLTLIIIASLGCSIVFGSTSEEIADSPKDFPELKLKPGEPPPAEEYYLEPGYKLELIADELTFPTMITFGKKREIYICEGGLSSGPASAIPRILQITDKGKKREIARLPKGPVSSICYHLGFIYAIGGRAPAEIWQVNVKTGEVTTILTGFPVWGPGLASEILFGPDGKMYFSIGTASNSGVIGLNDYYTSSYLSSFPDAHDIPAVDLVLTGENFSTDNPFTPDPSDQALTGPFHKFGEPSYPGEIIQAGTLPNVNGVVCRSNPDGSALEVFASGFRNLSGMAFSPDGRLFGVEPGMENGGSRPVANDLDSLREIKKDCWYGFPDYPSGFPITAQLFDPLNKPAPTPLLVNHPPMAEGPFYRFPNSSATHHFAFSTSRRFGYTGDLFAAQYGSEFLNPPRGYRIVRLNMQTKEAVDFYVNNFPGTKGVAPERPIAAQFGPDGKLYVVDFGELACDRGAIFSAAGTGAVWRISKIPALGESRMGLIILIVITIVGLILYLRSWQKK